MSGSEDEATDLPSAAECQKAIDNFVAFTTTDEALAQFYLQDHKWDVEAAVNAYYVDTNNAAASSSTSVLETKPSDVIMSTKAPSRFTFLTWNIDGLCEKNLKPRNQHIAKIIEENKYTVVFLQEVIPESLRYFEYALENYSIFSTEDHGPYFTAILLRSGTIYMDEGPTVVPYTTTSMGRSLLIVRAHIGKAKFVFMNTHLESTADHSGERLKQLKLAFRYMSDEDPSEVSVILAGDLNLRDKELDEAGGMPYGVQDLWTVTGCRKECKYTWDMSRNTNLEFPGRYKPRARFDRIYLRSSNPEQIKPSFFGLVGIEKVPGTQSFPSDHWGIEAHFEILVNS